MNDWIKVISDVIATLRDEWKLRDRRKKKKKKKKDI